MRSAAERGLSGNTHAVGASPFSPQVRTLEDTIFQLSAKLASNRASGSRWRLAESTRASIAAPRGCCPRFPESFPVNERLDVLCSSRGFGPDKRVPYHSFQRDFRASATLAFACAVGLASAAGASDFIAFAARLGSSRHHGSSVSGAHRRSASSHHTLGAVRSSHASEPGRHHRSSVTSHCQNVPADNTAGTYQFSDSRCGDGAMGSVPGCVGDKHDCRFCQTSIVPKHSRNEGWPTCPASVCAELKTLGCKGESSASKKEVLWQLAREKALAHNAAVKGVSLGKCATTAADRKIGRHQFSDTGTCTHDSLGPGCLGGGSTCRFCQLSTSKADSTDWPVCPDVVCKKWKVKGGGCEPPLSLVTVPPEHPPADFDVTAAMDEQTKKMKAAIHGTDRDEGDDEGDAAPRKSRRTRATGDLVVDLLQSEDRGADGLDEHLRLAYAKKSSAKSKHHGRT